MRALVVVMMCAATSAHAQPLELEPTLLLEVDARVSPREEEASTGFALARMRPGVRLNVNRWLGAFAQLELTTEYAEVQDAYVELRPSDDWSVRVGFAKAPLFPSHREPVHTLPFPDVTPVAKALRTSRDLGVGVAWRPAALPIEAFARVGNGASSYHANDNMELAYYLGADLVLGRAHRLHAGETFGLRLGVTGLYESTEDRAGVRGSTLLGFGYFRAPVVSGDRFVGEAHATAFIGPVRVRVEAGMAHEGRSRDDDGNPGTPRVALDASRSTGVSTEIAATLVGTPRAVDGPPTAASCGALEVAGRVDRLWLARNTDDLEGGGAVELGLAVKWGPLDAFALTLAGAYARYDREPIEEPGEDDGWGVMLRASIFAGQ